MHSFRFYVNMNVVEFHYAIGRLLVMKRTVALCLCLMFLLCSCAVVRLKQDSKLPTMDSSSKNEQESTTKDETTPSSENPGEDEGTEEGAASEWKAAYLAYIETVKNLHLSYELVYVDGDDIPELYLSGVSEAIGDGICSYKNGRVVEQRLNRTGGGRYVERSGNIINENGNMGVCYTDVYRLTEEGFQQTFSAALVERTENLDDEYVSTYEYYLGDIQVEEDAYQAGVEAAFDPEGAQRLGENAVPYDSITQMITDL